MENQRRGVNVAVLLTIGFILMAVDRANSEGQSEDKIYSNAQYEFSFSYPRDNPVSTLNDGSTSRPFRAPSIAYFKISDNKQTEGRISVNVSVDRYEVFNCTRAASGISLPTVNINGSIFNKLDGGRGEVWKEREYKTLRATKPASISSWCLAPSACVSAGCEDRLWSGENNGRCPQHIGHLCSNF